MADALRGPANIDCEELIAGMSYALCAHAVGYAHRNGSRTAPNAASGYISGVFDETGLRLTGDDPSRAASGTTRRPTTSCTTSGI
jgi:hypothetical protein